MNKPENLSNIKDLQVWFLNNSATLANRKGEILLCTQTRESIVFSNDKISIMRSALEHGGFANLEAVNKRGEILEKFLDLEMLLKHILKSYISEVLDIREGIQSLIDYLRMPTILSTLKNGEVISNNLKKKIDKVYKVRDSLVHQREIDKIPYENSNLKEIQDKFIQDFNSVVDELLNIYVSYLAAKSFDQLESKLMYI